MINIADADLAASSAVCRVGVGAEQDPDCLDASQACYQPPRRRLDYGLDKEQQAAFHRDGFLHLRGVFGAEDVAAWREAAEALLSRDDLVHPDNLRIAFVKGSGVGLRPVWKIDPFVDLHTTFGALTRDRRILDVLASLYEGREPRLFKDKLIYKPPGGHGSGIHQDYHWWQGFPTSLISVMVAIDPANETNGCTEVFPGYQQGLLTEAGKWTHLKDSAVKEIDKGTPIITDPGDIALFHCHTPHRAAANHSSQFRRQAFLTYNDSRDGEHYFAHREHFWRYVTMNREADAKRRAYFF